MPPKKKRRGDHSGGEWKVQVRFEYPAHTSDNAHLYQKGRRFRRDKNDSNTSHNEQKGAGYKDLVKESELFEKYYQVTSIFGGLVNRFGVAWVATLYLTA